MTTNLLSWEETIRFIRKKDEYKTLVEKAYFAEDLKLNVERFKESQEFSECLRLIQEYQPNCQNILDVGCGNGISSISFALKGYNVTCIEPDPSDTIGAGAIRKLKEIYQLDNINVICCQAGNIDIKNHTFDVVYVRQAMHHANDLEKFVASCANILKQNGLFFTVRDHVIFNKKDKTSFLQHHPLHKFYGGENAYTDKAYRHAIKNASLNLDRVLKYYDSPINYFPITREEIMIKLAAQNKKMKNRLSFLYNVKIFRMLYEFLQKSTGRHPFDERKVHGRMYSYLAIKS